MTDRITTQGRGAHTGGPWHVYAGATDDCIFRKGKTVCALSGGTSMAVAYCDYHTPDLAKANAEFIVRACNSHDDLLAALKDALSGWQYIRTRFGDLHGVGWNRVEIAAKSAIAKAESHT